MSLVYSEVISNRVHGHWRAGQVHAGRVGNGHRLAAVLLLEMTGISTPSQEKCGGSWRRLVACHDILRAYGLVVAGRMVFGEIIRLVVDAFFPGECEIILCLLVL